MIWVCSPNPTLTGCLLAATYMLWHAPQCTIKIIKCSLKNKSNLTHSIFKNTVNLLSGIIIFPFCNYQLTVKLAESHTLSPQPRQNLKKIKMLYVLSQVACKRIFGLMWWLWLLNPALGRQKQMDLCEFKASLIYIANSRSVRVHGKTLFKRKQTKQLSQNVYGLKKKLIIMP